MMRNSLLFAALLLAPLCAAAEEAADMTEAKAPHYDAFHPGEVWRDQSGEPIQAHGGGILYHDGVYYWYGENKSNPTYEQRVDVVGVSCYSSKDLYNWKHEGVVLPAVKDEPEHDLHPSKVVERPKVLFNEETGKFVMWMHIDQPGYQFARVGVAVSASPTGPFAYRGSMRPNGFQSRDMTLFKDTDGAAYLITGVGWHTHVHIARLTDDFLDLTGDYVNVMEREGPPHGREAPAIFKRDGRYYLITSGTTGWHSNPAEVAVADSLFGPWEVLGNPTVGEDAEITFHAQSTFVLPVQGMEDAFIFMADRWNPEDLGDSRYVWLPIDFEDGKPVIRWRDSWGLSYFKQN